MRWNRLLALTLVLVAFSTVSAIALRDFGYLGLWRLIGQDTGTMQLFADLTVAMFLVTSWMIRDARTSRVPAWPYVVLTVAAGSVGPLGYLLHREVARSRR